MAPLWSQLTPIEPSQDGGAGSAGRLNYSPGLWNVITLLPPNSSQLFQSHTLPLDKPGVGKVASDMEASLPFKKSRVPNRKLYQLGSVLEADYSRRVKWRRPSKGVRKVLDRNCGYRWKKAVISENWHALSYFHLQWTKSKITSFRNTYFMTFPVIQVECNATNSCQH